MKKSFWYSATSMAALAAVMVTATPARAQLEEIVVTAERREASLQDVPVAVTAYSEADIERFNIEEVTDIDVFAPGLRVINNVASSNALNVNLRGSTEAGGAFLFSEPGVGLYLNGVYRRLAGGNIELADIQRIEVLRGPQGTLFGRNTLAGAINIVTKKPDPTEPVNGSVTLKVGSFERYSARASIYAPVSDTLAVAVAGLYKDQGEGYYTNVVDGEDVGKDQFAGVTGALRWQPNERFLLDATLFASSNDRDGQYAIPVDITTKQRVTSGDDVAAGTATFPDGSTRETFSESETFGGDLTLEYDFDWATLKSISAFSQIDDAWAIDFTAAQFASPDPAIRGTAGFFRDTDGEISQYSQEFQLLGTTDTLEWTAGAYYYWENTEQLIEDSVPALFFLPGLGVPETYDLTTTSIAAYGQVKWQFAPSWSAIAGARYTADNKEMEGSKENGPFATAPTPFASDEDFSQITFKAGIEWQPNDDILTYLTFSQGYKAGTYNAGAPASVYADPLDEEEVDSFELGFKGDLFEDTVRLNAAAFYLETSNLAIGQIRENGDVFQDNVGESNLYGLELEGIWAPTDRFTGRLSLTLQDGEWQSVGDQPPGGIQIDEELPGVAQYQFTIGADYRVPLKNGGDITFLADVRTTDGYFNTTAHNDDPVNETEGYTTVNAGAIFESADGKHQVALRGQNLFDTEDYYITLIFGLNNTGAYYPVVPRTFDLSYTYRF